MGGGGQVEPTAANNANTALLCHLLHIRGPRCGCLQHLWSPDHSRIRLFHLHSLRWLFPLLQLLPQPAFAIVAGAILGVGTGLLWAAESAIMTSHPSTARKGSYIFLFWTIFNLGDLIGGIIPFVLNYDRTKVESVNDATYITFMCFMSTGALLSFSILHPSRVIRNDGTRCTNVKYSNFSTEAVEILKLFRNWKMLLRLAGPAISSTATISTRQWLDVQSEDQRTEQCVILGCTDDRFNRTWTSFGLQF